MFCCSGLRRLELVILQSFNQLLNSNQDIIRYNRSYVMLVYQDVY